MAEKESRELFQLLQQIEQRCLQYAAGLPQKQEVRKFWEGVLFTVSGVRLVTPLTEVKEILNLPPVVTSVPGTLPWVRGVANVRGNLLPIIDLQLFLDGRQIQVGRRNRILVMGEGELYAGLMVETILGIRRFPEEFRTQSGGVAGPVGAFVQGSFVLEGENWPIFSMKKLARSENFQSAAA